MGRRHRARDSSQDIGGTGGRAWQALGVSVGLIVFALSVLAGSGIIAGAMYVAATDVSRYSDDEECACCR